MATTKRKVGRPRKDQPAQNPYIELEELDDIIDKLAYAIMVAKEARTSVLKASNVVLESRAEQDSVEALLLYQNRQEMYFARIHADAIVESMEFAYQRFLNMRKLFTVEPELRDAIEKELIRMYKK